MVSEQEDKSKVDSSFPQDEMDAPVAASVRITARDKRRQMLLFLCFGSTLMVITGLWWYDYFEKSVIVQEPFDPPDVRFDKLYQAALDDDDTTFHVAGFPVDDSMMPRIGELKMLDTLIIDQGIVTDDMIDSVAQLTKLRHLRMRLSPIGDAGLRELTKCKELWFLNLPHSSCTAEGVAELKSLEKLRQLRLGSKELDNQVTNSLTQIRSLRGLHLIGVPITDEGLKKIAALPLLESLYLDDSAVTQAGWEWLFREYPHLHVHIDQYHHDRDPKTHDHHD